MFAAVFSLILAQAAVEPARTVNGQELGPAEQFTTPGPAVVCMRELVIRPRAGQSVQLGYSGIHAGTLRLTLENGRYVDFNDGEIFIDQRRVGQGPTERHHDMRIYLIDDRGPDVRYQLEGTAPETDYYSPPRVFVSGTGVAGNRTDRSLFALVHFEDPATVDCDRRYTYGWRVLLDGEPFDVQKAPDSSEEEH